MFCRAEYDGLPAVDMHIHTVYSGHAAADMTLNNIVARAEQVGLKQIAVTEHVWDIQHSVRLENLQKELEQIEPTITVRLGVEIDPDPKHDDGRLIGQVKECFRPRILGMHSLPESTVMWNDPDVRLSSRGKKRLVKQWFRKITSAVQQEYVDVLAHPGVIIGHPGPVVRYEAEILDNFADLFGVMRSHGVAFEINEHVKRKLCCESQRETYHNLPALAAELGVKISVASDAHELWQIGQYDWVSRVVQRAGLRANDFRVYNGPGVVKGPIQE